MLDADRPVSEIMRSQFVTLGVKDKLDLADALMHFGRVRHLPVLDGDRLVGLLSQRDVLAHALSKALEFDAQERRTFLHSIDVAEAMSRKPVTVRRETSLREAARLVLAHRIGSLPVVDDAGRAVGLVTETDLLREAYGADLGADPGEDA
jgi:CBS domain-containing protein